MAPKDWEIEAEKGRKILRDSIPTQWLLPEDELPPKDRLNVLAIPEESGLLTETELQITSSSATSLVSKMSKGEWTAEQVTIAYLKRATIGHQLLNNATEFMVEDAIAQARVLDKYFETHGKVIGPLHGVPISTKEHIWHKGRVANGGYVAFVDKIAPTDSHLVRLSKNAGAIFHLRTNEPQTLMTGEANNNITGQTLNGTNLSLSTGGSSGGEGASISFKSAAIGFGTDIGGSIRIPAAFNGVYGFRPTACRMPYDGIELPGAGQESIKCVIGPLARSIEDVELVLKTTLDQRPWEEEVSLVPLPWRVVKRSRDITVGVMWNDGLVELHPPMRRALRTVVGKLKGAGVKVVDWEPYKSMEILEIISTLFFPEGAKTCLDIIAASGEPLNSDAKAMLANARELTVLENWAYNERRDKLRAKYHALMKEKGVDVILCAPYVGCAPRRNDTSWGNYTMMWNMLDHPALVFPTGLSVDAALDPVDAGYKPMNDYDKGQYERYSPEVFNGAPLCLQLAGKHFQDEELLAAAHVIEGVVYW